MKSSLLITVFAIAAVNSWALGQQMGCGVPVNPTASNYIIGGDDASPHEFPWQVSLQIASLLTGWTHNCGGSIIDNKWILTAAHCVDTRIQAGRMRVVLGAYDISRSEKMASAQEIVRRSSIIMHPMWNLQTMDYDFALIELPQPLNFTGKDSHLAPICMPKATESKVFENMDCVVSGWGRIKDIDDIRYIAKILQKMPVRVPTHDQCVRAWLAGGSANGAVRLTPRHICAATQRGEGSGVCNGDSGGPLQCNRNGRWYLAGAASFVRYCGSKAHPNVYARVTSALDWIERVKAARARATM